MVTRDLLGNGIPGIFASACWDKSLYCSIRLIRRLEVAWLTVSRSSTSRRVTAPCVFARLKTCSIILDSGVCSVLILESALRLGSMILNALLLVLICGVFPVPQ